ncbi:adenosylmethionine decarboxylase [Thalassobaculum fulvum]|jgi:S-adenosylmethionine decarboxylase|nr:adenosylmethionine decarboxylase [Thalassobaculum fulvum]
MDQKLAAKLGMDSATQPSEFHAAPQGADTLEARDTGHEDNVIRLPSAGVTTSDERLDHFVKRDGLTFAGTHLIIDLWGAKRLDELEHIEEALKECVTAAGATLLHCHLHHFSPNGGVSGVAVLAESHISIHTWPECDYAALDVFMCGDAKPHAAIEVLKRAFEPATVNLGEHKRGMVV